MSNPDLSSPFRGPPRSSHLRQISNISAGTISSLAPNASVQGDCSEPQDDIFNGEAIQPKHVQRICTLWVHEESFSREDVILNFALFPKGSVRAGDLAEIVALKSNSEVRDFQDAVPKNPRDSNTFEGSPIGAGAERRRSPSNTLNLEDTTNKSLQSKRYVFIAKDMSSEQKLRQPNLQVGGPSSNKINLSLY
jgi:DEP domain-containing protein 5